MSTDRDGPLAPASPNTSATPATESITLGGGCFWCLEAVYELVDGVLAVESGYSNGHVPDPGYERVCSGTTGHAEVVQVRFDPARITLTEILEIFFHIHDPTTLNRQGNDVGTQYRSGIYYHTPEQKAAAEATIKRLTDAGKYKRPIATKVEPAPTFWVAEDYHQQYFFTRGIPNTCHIAE